MNLPIVQAPFRIYYAYNPLRLHQTLVAPNDLYNPDNLYLAVQSAGIGRSAASGNMRSHRADAVAADFAEPGKTELF